MLKISIRGKVWKYEGPAGWYFLSIDKKTSKRLDTYKGRRVAWGYIPVRARVQNTEWNTTLFPSKGGLYLLAIKASVRKKEHIEEGDMVTVLCSTL